MLLDVSHLEISYAQKGKEPKPTVHDVTFSLEKGEVLAIVGESGSGKTTVIRALLGCLPVGGQMTGGMASFDGQDLRTLPEKGWQKLRGRDISMIFQDSGSMMNPVQTIGHQYVEFLRTHEKMTKSEARAMAVEKLAHMNLPSPEHIMDSYAFELSGGMRQRVGIAMAITFQPKLLLADEPTSALDVTTQAQIAGELTYVTRGLGTAMIIVTHNIGLAAALSDRILVMAGGRVVEYGAAQEVMEHPQADYTKSLLASVPEIGGRRYVE